MASKIMRFDSGESLVQYLGPNMRNGSMAIGLPTFQSLKGGVAAMMRDPKEEGGRAIFVLKVGELMVKGANIPTRFQCYIPLEEEEEFFAKFTEEGSAFSVRVSGFPKLENDGKFYRSPREGNMAFVLVTFTNLVVEPIKEKKAKTSLRNKNRMNYASKEEMAPVIRAAIQGNKD